MTIKHANLITLFWFIFIQSVAAQVEPENFELTITGALVEKLEPGTIISVGTLGTSKEHPYVAMSTTVENLPLYLPKKHFQNRYLRVHFLSGSFKTAIFSMEVSSDLLDEVRPIKLKLDKPNPNLRTIGWWDCVRYKPSVSQRMAYMELPYWDNETGKLAPIPNKPVLYFDNGDDKRASIEMGDFCMGDKWHARLSGDLAPKKDSKITYSVDYDSGGLFDKVSTQFQYEYRIEK